MTNVVCVHCTVYWGAASLIIVVLWGRGGASMQQALV